MGRERGGGAERHCRLVGGVDLVEPWTDWGEGHSFTYIGVGVPLLVLARNTWTVTSAGDATLLTTTARVVIRGGVFGRLLEPVVAWQSRRGGRLALARIAHLAELGEPAAHAWRPPRPFPALC